MKLVDVLAQIGEPGCLDALRPGWEDSVATVPPGPPSFLDPAEFRAGRQLAKLADQADAILEVAATYDK